MANHERHYAAQQLLQFLRQVGSIEAAWAMATALDVLLALPNNEDYIAAASAALAAAEAADPAATDPPPAATAKSARGGKAGVA